MQRNPDRLKTQKERSWQKLREKTMGMAKIFTRSSWTKITWHRKKKRKIKTISKDNKMVDSLIAQIKRLLIVFIRDLEHSNPLLTQMKRHGIIKC